LSRSTVRVRCGRCRRNFPLSFADWNGELRYLSKHPNDTARKWYCGMKCFRKVQGQR
jgi:hypothetical protein